MDKIYILLWNFRLYFLHFACEPHIVYWTGCTVTPQYTLIKVKQKKMHKLFFVGSKNLRTSKSTSDKSTSGTSGHTSSKSHWLTDDDVLQHKFYCKKGQHEPYLYTGISQSWLFRLSRHIVTTQTTLATAWQRAKTCKKPKQPPNMQILHGQESLTSLTIIFPISLHL